jgi:regulator of chromosome condensation
LFFKGGEHHTLILSNDSKVYSIGRMHYGRLGIGLPREHLDQCRPLTEITLLEQTSIRDIICGAQTSFASDEGKLFAWGFGTTLQLGLGHENDIFSPVTVTLKQNLKIFKALKVSSDSQHTLIIACE